MVRRYQPPSQTWRTFLRNHIGQIVAADFFVVPIATYRLLFVLVLLAHDRGRISHDTGRNVEIGGQIDFPVSTASAQASDVGARASSSHAGGTRVLPDRRPHIPGRVGCSSREAVWSMRTQDDHWRGRSTCRAGDDRRALPVRAPSVLDYGQLLFAARREGGRPTLRPMAYGHPSCTNPIMRVGSTKSKSTFRSSSAKRLPRMKERPATPCGCFSAAATRTIGVRPAAETESIYHRSPGIDRVRPGSRPTRLPGHLACRKPASSASSPSTWVRGSCKVPLEFIRD